MRGPRLDSLCGDAPRRNVNPSIREGLGRREVVSCIGNTGIGESQTAMTTFKRVSLAGSEELFRPTRPQVVTDTDEVIRGAVDRHEKVKEVVLRTLNFTPEEIELDRA